MATDNRSKSTTQNNSDKGDTKDNGDATRPSDTRNESAKADDEPTPAYGSSGAKDSH